MTVVVIRLFFFFNDTATTEIYTLSLHDALPIYQRRHFGISARRSGALAHASTRADRAASARTGCAASSPARSAGCNQDRKSTRLNSSHSQISYAVFCLKKKKKQTHRLLFPYTHI